MDQSDESDEDDDVARPQSPVASRPQMRTTIDLTRDGEPMSLLEYIWKSYILVSLRGTQILIITRGWRMQRPNVVSIGVLLSCHSTIIWYKCA